MKKKEVMTYAQAIDLIEKLHTVKFEPDHGQTVNG